MHTFSLTLVAAVYVYISLFLCVYNGQSKLKKAAHTWQPSNSDLKSSRRGKRERTPPA